MNNPTPAVIEHPAVPMGWRDAASYGYANAKAITQQSVRGLPRTIPLWALGAAPILLATRLRRHPIPLAATITGIGFTANLAWITGFAGFTGARTTWCGHTQTNTTITIMRIRAGDMIILAGAHHTDSNPSYVTSVFAWPRGHGAGRIVLTELLNQADAAGVVLTLTALTPRLGAMYRKFGFTGWHYHMHRNPVTAATGSPRSPGSHRCRRTVGLLAVLATRC